MIPSGAELMVVFLVALVVLGPDRLPVVARKAGQVLGELRKVSAGFEAEMRTAMYESESRSRPPADPAASPGAAPDPTAPDPTADTLEPASEHQAGDEPS